MAEYRGVNYYSCSCCHDSFGRRLRPGPKYWIPEQYFSGRTWGEKDSPHFYTVRDVERAIRDLLAKSGRPNDAGGIDPDMSRSERDFETTEEAERVAAHIRDAGGEAVLMKPLLGYGTSASMARADRPSPKREVTMPRDLWTEIDAAVEARGISRAAWLQEAAREKLERERAGEAYPVTGQ